MTAKAIRQVGYQLTCVVCGHVWTVKTDGAADRTSKEHFEDNCETGARG